MPSNTTFASSMPRKTKEYLYINTIILCTISKNLSMAKYIAW